MTTPLIERFSFTRRIEFEEMEKGHEVIALPDKTIIRTDDESAGRDMAELFSLAKLAETDPLLCTFFFQKEYSEQEASYMRMFHQLCQPLQDAWAWKTMRREVQDIYEQEIEETYNMFNMLQGEGTDKKVSLGQDNRRIYLGLFCILFENPENNTEVRIETDETNKADWDNYITALKKYVRLEPDIKHYLELPLVTNACYTVELCDGFFSVKQKDRNVLQ